MPEPVLSHRLRNGRFRNYSPLGTTRLTSGTSSRTKAKARPIRAITAAIQKIGWMAFDHSLGHHGFAGQASAWPRSADRVAYRHPRPLRPRQDRPSTGWRTARRRLRRPSAPPVWRTMMPAAVAVPIVSRGTAFCTAVVTTGKMQPMPRPTMVSDRLKTTMLVSRCNWVIRIMPKLSNDMPMIGRIPVFPGLAPCSAPTGSRPSGCRPSSGSAAGPNRWASSPWRFAGTAAER